MSETKSHSRINQQEKLVLGLYSHEFGWIQTGFGLVISFICCLRIAITSNCVAIANPHTLQITRSPVTSSQPSRFLVADLNNGDSLCSRRCPLANAHNWLIASIVLFITSRHGPRINHRSSLVVQLLLFNYCLLRICFLSVGFVSLFVSRSLPSNGCLHATIFITLKPLFILLMSVSIFLAIAHHEIC
jgi:hypothetical protein